jgi:hypothetical protein
MLTPALLRSKADLALPYDQYVASGTGDQQSNWARHHSSQKLTDPQLTLLAGFTRQIHTLVLSGIWCGDCAVQVPMLDHIANATDRISLRILDRDEHMDLAEQVMICGGLRVPTVLFLNEDFEFLAIHGDKSLSRLRTRGVRLGVACMLPGAGVPSEEAAATMADWVTQFEYAHLIARLSPKFRERHGD